MRAALMTNVSQTMRAMEALGDESVFCDAVYRQHESIRRRIGRTAPDPPGMTPAGWNLTEEDVRWRERRCSLPA